MTRAAAEAGAAGWVALGNGDDLGENPIAPSQSLLNDVTDFARRVERPARSAGTKRRRQGDPSPPAEASSAPAGPVAPAGFVVSPIPATTTDPEVFRRFDVLQSSLNKLTREVTRLATEVANLKDSDDDSNAGGDSDDDN